MPWSPSDSRSKTHLADSTRRQKMWAEVANNALQRTGDDATAVQEANGVIRRDHEKHGGKEPKGGTTHWSGR